MADRRTFLKTGALTGAGVLLPWRKLVRSAYAQIEGGTLPPGSVTKYLMPLVIPPAMPKTKTISSHGQTIDYYEIAVRQFTQQILPTGLPPTTVWSYGSVQNPATFNYPAFTIESQWRRPVRVKWINQLVDSKNNYLPHLLPVDQTLHWANPPGPRDSMGTSQTTYTGPVPMVVHVHGAHATQDSDGYAEAWYLPNAKNIPAGYIKTGSWYDKFKSLSLNGSQWTAGSAVFQYANDQRAATIWYHDHSLGMTRLNVYAGPAGFYLIRGGPDDRVTGTLPGPAPGVGANPFGTFYEIPIAIQDRSFNTNGSLFYPSSRTFFDGFGGPYAPATDVPPIWNPEFFGNMMLVNGRTWPFLNVERRRYRFRILNGCNGRFLILKLTTSPRTDNSAFNTPEASFWQIGTEGGFLPPTPGAIELQQVLVAPAERADVIIDFSDFDVGDEVYLVNDGPDAPFGGISLDEIADHASTGQVMKFVVGAGPATDPATHPSDLVLPPLIPLSGGSTRQVSLNEEMSAVVDADGILFAEGGNADNPAGPVAALLGTYASGVPTARRWMDAITENPALGATEVWEFYNFTADAHPMHIHEVQFNVVNREALDNLDDDGVAQSPAVPGGSPRPPEAWETGFKDTVIAYPGEVTRVRAKFDLPGQYVWHCHIVEHEDNEMMRPFRVGP